MENEKFVDVEIELDNATWLELAMGAHKLGITLNEHVNSILREQLDRMKTAEATRKDVQNG